MALLGKARFVPGATGTSCASELSVEVFCMPSRYGGVAKNPRSAALIEQGELWKKIEVKAIIRRAEA